MKDDFFRFFGMQLYIFCHHPILWKLTQAKVSLWKIQAGENYVDQGKFKK